MTNSDLYRNAKLASCLKINVIRHIYRLKKKNRMTVSVDSEEARDKMYYLGKNSQKTRNSGGLSQLDIQHLKSLTSYLMEED